MGGPLVDEGIESATKSTSYESILYLRHCLRTISHALYKMTLTPQNVMKHCEN